MITRTYIIHALTPLHCGTGQGVGIVDLPIARMRSTGIPVMPGSSGKGVLRDHSERVFGATDPRCLAVFGPDTKNAADHAGAVVIGDARLLALPVRSFVGVFGWVTSPLLLTLASRDLMEGGRSAPPIPRPSKDAGVHPALVATNSKLPRNKTVYLEDLDLLAEDSKEVDQWAAVIAALGFDPDEAQMFQQRLVVVDDETMAFLWTTATQVDARNRLGDDGTVVDGALWYEESLPPESLLIGLMGAHPSRAKGPRYSAEQVLGLAVPKSGVVQIGGKTTVGRGICRLRLDRTGLDEVAP